MAGMDARSTRDARPDDRAGRPRLNSYLVSLNYNGSSFPVIKGKDAVTDQGITTDFQGYSIVIVASSAGCFPEEDRELKHIESVKASLRANGINVVTLYFADDTEAANKQEAMWLRKLSGTSFPVWHTNSQRFEKYFDAASFPGIFLLHNQTVVSSFFGSRRDEQFSLDYVETLKSVLSV